MARMAPQTVALLLVAVVFSAALTWVAIELPRAVNRLLLERLEFPQTDPGIFPEEAEAFIDRYRLRAVGAASLGFIALLIVAGLAAERRGLAAAGGIAFFLPVFGHFCRSMFFLAALGMLRVPWIPIVDTSFDLLRLGDVVYLPYMALVWPLALVGIDGGEALAWLCMGGGMLVFVLGVFQWFRSKLSADGTVRFGLYRFSRHPQYLGWILWSYGFMLYFAHHLEANFKKTWSFADSLPWVVSTLVIVGVALVEEIQMLRRHGEAYAAYRESTPFLLPLPPGVASGIASCTRRLIGRERPESGRQVLAVVLFWGAVGVLLSLPFVLFSWPPRGGWWAFPYSVFPFR